MKGMLLCARTREKQEPAGDSRQVLLHIADEDYEPDFILDDGSRVYSLPDVDEDFEPDYILADGSRVYDLDNYEPDYVIINGVRVYADGRVG